MKNALLRSLLSEAEISLSIEGQSHTSSRLRNQADFCVGGRNSMTLPGCC